MSLCLNCENSTNDAIKSAITSVLPDTVDKDKTTLSKSNNDIKMDPLSKREPKKRIKNQVVSIIDTTDKVIEHNCKAKKIDKSYSSDATDNNNATWSAKGSLTTSRYNQNATYSANDFGLFIVYVYVDTSDQIQASFVIGNTITNIDGNEAIKIKSIGRSKIMVVFKSTRAANTLMASTVLKYSKYIHFYIISYFITKSSVVMGIPVD